MVAGGITVLIGADPASAHYTSVWGKGECNSDTGKWEVTWHIKSNKTNLQGALSSVVLTPATSTSPDITVGATVPYPGELVGKQIIDGTWHGTANIAVRTTWTDNWTDSQDVKGSGVEISTDCVQNQPKPNFAATPDCSGTVALHLTNDADATKDANFTVDGANGYHQTFLVHKNDHADVTVPAKNASSIDISVPGFLDSHTAWKQPPGCEPIKVSSLSDCKTLTVTLENPSGNAATVDAVIAVGSDSRPVTISAGGTASETFDASAGTTATVTFGAIHTTAFSGAVPDSAAPVTIAWQLPRGTACAPPPPPTLPTTGAHLGPVIAAGGGLLIIGAGVLFLLFRRRVATESKTF